MLNIITVPAFSDNYIWLICDEKRQYAAIVDPGDAKPVLETLKSNNIEPCAILITHFHSDHIGGISALKQRYPNLPVYGPATERIPQMTDALVGGETIQLDQLKTTFEVMAVHGHTAGHIAYYTKDQQNNSKLFCGDTLFAAGCGRVFNGTLEDLHNSLQRISQLPDDTLIYCAHEYTLDNIGFAKWVEPDSSDLIAREEASMDLLDADQATVPSTLELEKQTNPFLRTHLPHVVERVAEMTGKTLTNSTEVFAAMRTWKDSEYD